MKKLIYRLIHPLRAAYWTIFRAKTIGVTCLIECDAKLLMIRHTYGHRRWTFPGGGVKKGETSEEAVQRECREEVGIELKNQIYLGEYFNNNELDMGHCFVCRVPDFYFRIDGEEVAEAGWFDLANIPTLHAPAVNKVLDLYQRPGPPRYGNENCRPLM